jgi:DNA (cytosine-5)-methyltransferase 1
MSGRPRLLDLFCGAGGAEVGYHRVGFDVVGVDIQSQPNYPFEFVQADVAAWAAVDDTTIRGLRYSDFDAIHASPPCQAYSNAQRLQGRDHPDLIGPTRELLIATDLPYVIENVPGAPLLNPVVLEGQLFPGLRTSRPRLFETNWPLAQPLIPPRPPHTKMGRPPKDGEFMHVVGNFSGAQHGREAMGIDWMTRDELREAIPPAYCEFIGERLLAALGAAAVPVADTQEGGR